MKKKKKIRTTISFHFLLPLRIYWRRVSLFPFSREKTFERFSSSSSSTHRHSVNGGRHGEGETIVPPSSLERNYERDEVSIGILEYRRGGGSSRGDLRRAFHSYPRHKTNRGGEGDVYADYEAEISSKSERDPVSQNERST